MQISPEEFYSSTPAELHLKAIGHLEAVKRHAEMQATVTAIGVHNAMSKKKIKVFKDDKPVGHITKSDKQEELNLIRGS